MGLLLATGTALLIAIVAAIWATIGDYKEKKKHQNA